MGIPAQGPWGTLSNMITKKIGDARAREQKAKDDERDNRIKIRMAGIEAHAKNGTLTDDMIKQAEAEMGKDVPKDTLPIVQAWHKMVGALHKHKQAKQAGGGQGGGQATSVPSPTAAARTEGSAGGGGGGEAPASAAAGPIASTPTPSVPPSMFPSSAQLNKSTEESAAAAERGKAGPELDLYKQKGEFDAKAPERMSKTLAAMGFPKATIDKIIENNLDPTGAKPVTGKEPKPLFGPGGSFRGIEDPENNQTYLSRESIPPARKDLLKMWDDGKTEEDKQDQKVEAKERRQQDRAIERTELTFQNALKSKDYAVAIKTVADSKKQFQDSIDRMQTMDKNLADIVEAKKQGKENQQAQMSMLSNHIGMTSGAQPKMRMSKAQWDEAKDSVPLLQRIEAKFDSEGYLSGVVLTNDQMDQMVSLGHEKVEILKDHLSRLQEDPDYQEAVSARVPAKMRGPEGGKSKGGKAGKSKPIVVTKEDMQSVQ